MPERATHAKPIKRLEFRKKNLRDDASSYLSSFEKSKYGKITELVFDTCDISPRTVAILLLKLRSVKILMFKDCVCHNSVYNTVPFVERQLERLTVWLILGEDGRERGDFYDCHEILFHPQIRLPADELYVIRSEEPASWAASAKGDLYFEQFDFEEEWHTYMIGYIEKFKDFISLVRFDSGRRKIWSKLATENRLRKLQVQFERDLEREELDKNDPEYKALIAQEKAAERRAREERERLMKAAAEYRAKRPKRSVAATGTPDYTRTAF